MCPKLLFLWHLPYRLRLILILFQRLVANSATLWGTGGVALHGNFSLEIEILWLVGLKAREGVPGGHTHREGAHGQEGVSGPMPEWRTGLDMWILGRDHSTHNNTSPFFFHQVPHNFPDTSTTLTAIFHSPAVLHHCFSGLLNLTEHLRVLCE
jgi:hypothetical protein